MRSPGLMVISTILNWIAFIAGLVFQTTWPWEAYRGNNPSLFVLSLILLLVTAIVQTLFLYRNMQVSFTQVNADQSTEKAKRDSQSRAAHLVDTLDETERAQLLDWMLAQQEEDQRNAR
jgi:hypothetical protein